MKLKKETVKRIKNGDYGELMDVIEESFDLYNSTAFNQGYQSCLADLSVCSYRLAEYIVKVFNDVGLNCTIKSIKKGHVDINTDDLAKVIEDYYTKHLDK